MPRMPRSTAVYVAPIVPDKVYRNGPRFHPKFGPDMAKSGVGKFASLLGYG